MGEYAVGVATRTRIYRVCKGLFYEQGIKATSYNDICEAADINRGLIQYYFESKNNIAIEVLRDFVDSMEAAVNEWWGPDAMVQPERNIMIELLMFRLLAEDERACRFYSEIRADGAFHEARLKSKRASCARLRRSGVQVSDAALRCGERRWSENTEVRTRAGGIPWLSGREHRGYGQTGHILLFFPARSRFGNGRSVVRPRLHACGRPHHEVR